MYQFRSPASLLERTISAGDIVEGIFEAVVDLLESAVSNGVQAWELIDTINGTPGVRDVVYYSPGDRRLGGGDGDVDLFVRLTEGATTIMVRAYQDWSTDSHSGSREAGATGNGNSQWTSMSASTSVFFCGLANAYGLICGYRLSTTLQGRVLYFGNPIRVMVPPSRRGRGRLSAGVSSGATALPVDRNLVGQIQPGQKIWVYQTTPPGDSLVSPTVDLLTIDSLSASQIVTTTGVSQDLAAKALVGFDPSACYCGARVGGSSNRNGLYFTNTILGAYVSATGQASGCQPCSWDSGVSDAMASPDRWGRFIGADGMIMGLNATPMGFRGVPELWAVARARNTHGVTQFEPYEESRDPTLRYRILSDYFPSGWWPISIGPAPWTGTAEGEIWIRRPVTDAPRVVPV